MSETFRDESFLVTHLVMGRNPLIGEIHRMVLQLKLNFFNSGTNGICIRIDCFKQLLETMTIFDQPILELL